MKHQRVSILIILVTLFLATEAQASKHEVMYPISFKSTPLKVKLTNLSIVKKEDQLVLQGKVKRRSYNTHVVRGHIDYIITDINDMIVDKGVINSFHNLNLRRHNKGKQFTHVLPNTLPEGGRIELLWHTN